MAPYRHKIMLLTEDSHLGDIAARFLKKKHGWSVKTLSHIESAVLLCSTWFPDLIVLDLIDHGDGSVKFIRELHRQGGGTLPTLVLAGGFDWEDALGVDLVHLGVKGILRRPFSDSEKLFKTINEALDNPAEDSRRTSDQWPIQKEGLKPSRKTSRPPERPRPHSSGTYSIQQARPQRRSNPPNGYESTLPRSSTHSPTQQDRSPAQSSGSWPIQQEKRQLSSGSWSTQAKKQQQSSGSWPVQQAKRQQQSSGSWPIQEEQKKGASSKTRRIPDQEPKQKGPSSQARRVSDQESKKKGSSSQTRRIPEGSSRRPARRRSTSTGESPSRAPTAPPPYSPYAGPPSKDVNERLRYERRSMPESGSLSDWGVAELLYITHAEGTSGELVLRHSSRSTTIDIDQGSPCRVESSAIDESLSAYLEQKGHLTTAQRLTIAEEHIEKGLDHPQLLLSKGWVSPHELYQFLSEHATERLLDCFAWEEGDFSFRVHPSKGRHVIPLGLSPSRVIMTGISRHYNEARLVMLLPFSTEWALRVRNDGPVRPEAIHLTTFEARVLDLTSQGIQVRDLMDFTGRWTHALKVLYGLYLMEIVTFCDGPEGACRGQTPSPVPSTFTKKRTANAPPPVEKVESPLTSKELDELEKADYFKLLGLPRTATTDEIHASFRTRAKRFQPDELASLTKKDQDRAASVNRRLLEGYQVLAKPKDRKKYLRILDDFDAGEIQASSTIESFPPPHKRSGSGEPGGGTSPTKAQIAKAQRLLDENSISDALASLRQLQKEHPDNVRCLALYGFALYLESPELNLNRAQRVIGDARAKAPHTPWPYMMMARIRAREDSRDQAHELYLKARSLAPKDSEVIEEVELYEVRHMENEARDDLAENDDAEESGLSSRLRGLFKKR